MSQESRTRKTFLNARVNLIFYFLTLLLSFFSRKKLLLELVENIFGKKADCVHVSRRKGTAPMQFDYPEEMPIPPTTTPNTTETDDDDTAETDDGDLFSADELDAEGFEVNEM